MNHDSHFIGRFCWRVEKRHKVFRTSDGYGEWDFKCGFLKTKRKFMIVQHVAHQRFTSKQGKSLRALLGRMCVAK